MSTTKAKRRYPVAAGALVAAVAAATFLAQGCGGDGGAGALPDTPDYHSLLVSPTDPERLVLGTHEGLFESADGGRSWQRAELPGEDAMNLARAEDIVWAAGHNVLARSTDGGTTWEDVRPAGLPGLDVHGFAVDPRNPRTLYAAVAGQGLFRSTDGGSTFSLVSSDVGPGVMAMAVTPDGRLLAGDMQQGLFESRDEGRTWRLGLQAGLMGLAVNPKNPARVLATGPGILRSGDGGREWLQVLQLDAGTGPVAWSPSDPDVAYVVGFDRVLYRTRDGGKTWNPVGGE
ncbi:MAG TPA: YCF48-related protein [Gaiellaceae bacterium]|nr:YCF48-related protein [Gaiellaceae bacterium]